MPAHRSRPSARTPSGPLNTPALPLIDPRDHMRWARAIARGVRADYRFQRGSQEEQELEATAYLVLVEYAARFDPVAGYRRGMAAAVRRAIRARQTAPPTGALALTEMVTVAGIDVTKEVVALIHRLTRRRADRLAAAEAGMRAAQDLAGRFELAGAFRGWCAVEVRGRCRREAIRLRNGGTFHTTRTEAGKCVRVQALPQSVNGAGGELADHGVRPTRESELAYGDDVRRPTPDGESWSVYVTDPDE